MTTARAVFPRLHVVTDDRVLARPDFLETAHRLLAAGGSALALHVRGPHTSGAVVYRRVRDLLSAREGGGALVVVNDRVDVALATDVDGVHLGGRSLPLDAVRRLVGSGMLLGRSVHDAREARAAHGAGADFAFFGHVYETSSHRGAPGKGTAGLAGAVEVAGSMPVLAIGGVGPDRAADVVGAGAHGVAVLSGVWEAEEPEEAVRDYISALATCIGE